MSAPEPCTHSAGTGDLRTIAEGICPRCHVAIVRVDDHGLCPCCNVGWSLHGDTVSIHVGATRAEVATSEGTFHYGPGKLTFTLPT